MSCVCPCFGPFCLVYFPSLGVRGLDCDCYTPISLVYIESHVVPRIIRFGMFWSVMSFN